MRRMFAVVTLGAALMGCSGHDPCDGLACGDTCCLEEPIPGRTTSYLPCRKEGKCDRSSTCVDVTSSPAPVCQ